MPGPQMVAAMECIREIRGYGRTYRSCGAAISVSIYPDAALNAKYVDFVVRGQGEDTLLELIDALRGARWLESIQGLSYKDSFGLHRTILNGR